MSFLALLTGAGTLFAQDQPPGPPEPRQQDAPNRGWRRAEEPAQDQAQVQEGDSRNMPRDQYGQPIGRGPGDDRRDDRRYDAREDRRYDQASTPIPAQLTIRPGTYLTVRINQPLSTAHNQQGDAFSASLARPLVVDGIVVAQRGETIGGRVVESQRAGRVTGVSRMVIQITDLTLVDGQQIPIHSQLINRSGQTSVGSDAGAIAGTTAVGAAIGAGADYGRGAAIGAGAGAVAGIVGVLLTRGHDTYLDPESVLTFRVEAPVTFSTERGAQAFRYVESEDYDRAYQTEQRRPVATRRPPPYYYGYGYGYPYFGPTLAFGFGPRFGFGRGYYGRGYNRGYRR